MADNFQKFSSLESFISKLLKTCDYSLSSECVPIPVIVGAGISASSNIPVDRDLRANISQNCWKDHTLQYEELYEELSNVDPSPLALKRALRNRLHAGGIPRIVDG